MKIQYNQTIEVTELQYHYVMEKFAGIVAGREAHGKFFIRVWFMKYANNVAHVLNFYNPNVSK